MNGPYTGPARVRHIPPGMFGEDLEPDGRRKNNRNKFGISLTGSASWKKQIAHEADAAKRRNRLRRKK